MNKKEQVKLANLFLIFVMAAEKADVSWTICRRSGYSVDGQHTIDEEGNLLTLQQIPREHWKPMHGYTMEVDLQFFKQGEEERVYETPLDMMKAAITLLGIIVEEEK